MKYSFPQKPKNIFSESYYILSAPYHYIVSTPTKNLNVIIFWQPHTKKIFIRKPKQFDTFARSYQFNIHGPRETISDGVKSWHSRINSIFVPKQNDLEFPGLAI